MSRADPIDVPALERALERLKTIRADDARAEDRARALERENVELKRLVESLRTRPEVYASAPSSRARGVRFEDEGVEPISVHRSESTESLTTSAREKRLAGFRTKSHKFVVRECDEQGEGFTGSAGGGEADDDSDGLDDGVEPPCGRGRASAQSLIESPPSASAEARGTLKAAFELVLANDEGVEVLEPLDRKIRTKQKGLPHSKFSWLEAPRNALVVKKIHDAAAAEMMIRATRVLKSKGVTAWLERAVWDEFAELQGDCQTWDAGDANFHLDEIIDFIVVLGGDGTILWASKYFPKAMPPVVPFAMGSLGFLTSHRVDDMEKKLAVVMQGDFTISMRSRLVAKVVSAEGVSSQWRYVLNEVLIDRGPKPVMVELDIAVDGYHVTKVAADGVILSSPTGSTAYSLAAGGSMVHPGVPALCVTPICPHSLSFRPIVLPDSVVVTITCPRDARNTAWAAFDGKFQTELARGDAVVVRVAGFPVPSVCNASENNDWFAAVKQGLLWNARGADQKPIERKT